MAHPRRFRFGFQFHSAASADDWRTKVRLTEDLGYSTVFLPDHFGDQLAPVPALMAAADATTELRIGALVFDNDYKHPVVLAKEVATLDVLSGGRVEFGIGAGWMDTDYQQAGIEKDRAGIRIERLEEAVAVFKGLWGDGAFSYTGEHYRITGLDGLPKPVQQPHPPILIGGGGRRMLSVAARIADIVGVNPQLAAGAVTTDAGRDASAEQTDKKLAWVREAAGDRFDDIELNMLVFLTVVTDDREGVAQGMAPAFGLTPDEALAVPHSWVGTIDQICEHIEAARDRWGVSYWVLQGDDPAPMGPVVGRLAGR